MAEPAEEVLDTKERADGTSPGSGEGPQGVPEFGPASHCKSEETRRRKKKRKKKRSHSHKEEKKTRSTLRRVRDGEGDGDGDGQGETDGNEVNAEDHSASRDAAAAVSTEAGDDKDAAVHLDFDTETPARSLAEDEMAMPSVPLARVTLQEFEALKGQFEEMDKDGKGALTREEFGKALGLLSSDEVNQNVLRDVLFDRFDADGDGKVSYTEFLLSLAVMTKGSRAEKLEFAFGIMDRDHDGFIDRQEMAHTLSSMYGVLENLNVSVPDDKDIDRIVKDIFATLDLDNDGKISLEEYKQGANRNQTLLRGLGLLEDNSMTSQDLRSSGMSVTFGHTNWRLVLSMMVGMRRAVLLAGESPKALLPKHFTSKTVITPPTARYGGLQATFVDYAPHVFQQMRKMAGITEEQYMLSLGPEQLLGGILLGSLSTMTVKVSAGKSGSFFYTSHDGHYLVKTISRYEKRTLKATIAEYFEEASVGGKRGSKYRQHLLNYPDTLLCRILGFHSIGSIPFVVMKNVFHTQLKIHEVFDLKGSEYGRTNTSGHGPKKDLDWGSRKLQLPSEFGRKFVEQMEADSLFMEGLNILDYSLLLGIHRQDQDAGNDTLTPSCACPLREEGDAPFWCRDKGGMLSRDGKEVYFVGIIDIFTQYNARKIGEALIRHIVQHGENISTVAPDQYGPRFRAYLKSIVETD